MQTKNITTKLPRHTHCCSRIKHQTRRDETRREVSTPACILRLLCWRHKCIASLFCSDCESCPTPSRSCLLKRRPRVPTPCKLSPALAETFIDIILLRCFVSLFCVLFSVFYFCFECFLLYFCLSFAVVQLFTILSLFAVLNSMLDIHSFVYVVFFTHQFTDWSFVLLLSTESYWVGSGCTLKWAIDLVCLLALNYIHDCTWLNLAPN